MGTGASKADGSPLAELKAGWVLQYESSPVKYASASSLVVIKQADGGKVLALAFQASEAAHEGDRTQHLRLMLSRDAGETWSESKAVMWGAVPLWNPALHYDAGAGVGWRVMQGREHGRALCVVSAPVAALLAHCSAAWCIMQRCSCNAAVHPAALPLLRSSPAPVHVPAPTVQHLSPHLCAPHPSSPLQPPAGCSCFTASRASRCRQAATSSTLSAPTWATAGPSPSSFTATKQVSRGS